VLACSGKNCVAPREATTGPKGPLLGVRHIGALKRRSSTVLSQGAPEGFLLAFVCGGVIPRIACLHQPESVDVDDDLRARDLLLRGVGEHGAQCRVELLAAGRF